VHVLLIISAVGALDRLIVAVGRRRGWTRPVAWLGPALTVSAAALFAAVLLPGFSSGSVGTARVYEALGARMAAIGEPFRADEPVIHDFTVWLAETQRIPVLALPRESAADVLDLAAAFPGTRLVVVTEPQGDRWSGVLEDGSEARACFEWLDLGEPDDPAQAAALEGVEVYRIVCPAPSVHRDPRTSGPSP
jgi:hypothetical protein